MSAPARKPAIHLSERDYDMIAGLALSMEGRDPELATLILNEIDRARVCTPEALPADVVSIGTEVEFEDEASDVRRCVTLVVPQEADIEQGRISIMTSVGAGLIGMRAGQEIDWPYPDGRPRTLRVVSVRQPAEGSK